MIGAQDLEGTLVGSFLDALADGTNLSLGPVLSRAATRLRAWCSKDACAPLRRIALAAKAWAGGSQGGGERGGQVGAWGGMVLRRW